MRDDSLNRINCFNNVHRRNYKNQAALANELTIIRMRFFVGALFLFFMLGLCGSLQAESGLPPLKRKSIEVQLIQVRSLLPASTSTDPFDFKDLKKDIKDAQAGVTSVSNPVALSLFDPNNFIALSALITLTPVVFNIDLSGYPSNSLLLNEATGIDATATALQVISVAVGTAQFTAGSAWSITGSSNGSTVSDSISPSFYVQRNSGGDYYKITASFSAVSVPSPIRITALSGLNCGASMVGC